MFFSSIDKFTFSSDANAADVGDLLADTKDGAGQSSRTHGYTVGGDSGQESVIQKYSFIVDGNATDVGDLSTSHGYAATGQQV